MSFSSSIAEDQHQRRRIKSWTVFVTFFGSTFSALTVAGDVIRPFLHKHVPKLFAEKLEPREKIFFIALACLIGAIASGYHAYRFGRIFRFFGLSANLGLLFVLPTFRPNSRSAFKEVLKAGKIIKREKTLEDGPVYGHHNFDMIFRGMKLIPELQYADIFFSTDEDVMPVSRREPDAEHVDGKTVISFGSNSSNNLCTFLMNQYPFNEQEFFYRFDDSAGFNPETRHTGFSLVKNGVANGELNLVEKLEDNVRYDYAIILRHTTKFTTYFVCAGLDPHGSESNVTYLFEHWKKIRRWSGGRDFYAVARVDRESMRGVPLLRAVRGKSSEVYEIKFIAAELRGDAVGDGGNPLHDTHS